MTSVRLMAKVQRRPGVRALVSMALVTLILGGMMSPGCGGLTDEALSLEAAGDLEGAIALYEEVLRDDPDDVTALAGLASDLMLLGRYDEALAHQERVVTLDPDDAQTRIELGFNYLNHQDRPADAVRVLAEASALEPTAQHLAFLAQAQTVAGDPAAAEQNLRRAVDTEPTYGFSYALLRNLLRDQGRDAEAAALEELAASNGVRLEDLP